jgi:hypothetical protein
MSSRTATWVGVGALAVLGVVLIGDVVLLGLIPFAILAVVITLVFAGDRPAKGGPAHVRSQVRRQLLMGDDPNVAAAMVAPMLTSRSAGTRSYAAEMLAIAVQAGADEPQYLDALPRLADLAPTYRIGRALAARGHAEQAADVLSSGADGHDPVAWAEYLGTLALLGRFDDVRSLIATTPSAPSIESVIHSVRDLSDATATTVVRDALAQKYGDDEPAVMVLDVKLGRTAAALPAFIAAHQETTDGDMAAWVAWAGTVLGSPVALEHLDRLVGQAASGRTSVSLMLTSVQVDRPDIALRIAPSAIRSARIDVRTALHLTNAHALVATGNIDEAVDSLYLVPSDIALVAAITTPLAPSIQSADAYPFLVDHIVKN